MDPTPVDLGDLDLSGLSRDDILAALIDAAIIGAPDEAEFSVAEISTGKLPAHENATGQLAPPENSPDPGLSKSTVSEEVHFYSPDQLRDERGRWTAGGASGGLSREEHAARREAASAAIRDYLSATHQPTREETARLAGHLATITVKQLHDLRKEHGLKDPRLVKEDFVNALHGYFQQHREKQAVLARGREDEARRQEAKQAIKPTPQKTPAAGKADAGGDHQASVEQEFNRLLPGARGGLVSIPELRQRLGLAPADFERAVRELDRSDRLRLVAIGDRSRHTKEQLARGIEGENETFMYVEPGPHHAGTPPPAQPEPHQSLAAAVAGKQGFTQPFRRGPYTAVRHDPTGLHVEAEAGNHSGRFAVKDPSNVVHSRHDTAEAAVAAVQTANRLGTGESTVERELRDRAAQAGKGRDPVLKVYSDLAGNKTYKLNGKVIPKAKAQELIRSGHRTQAMFSEEGGSVDIDGPPGEGAVPDLIPASVPFSADPGGADEGRFVLKDAPVVFRAGPYDFPPEKGGPFEMTPDDIREALEDFPEDGVPITNEHNSRCIFHGKLGWFLRPQATPDYATFGGKVKLAKPVLDLLGGGPIKLSANWDRATKRLKDVSLTDNPRITDAALFAAFAKDADEGGTEKYITPHGRASMQAMHDMAARSGALCKSPAGVPPGASDRSAAAKPREAGMAAFTSEHERDAMQAIHDTATTMGAECATMKLHPKKGEALQNLMAQYTETPAPSAREQELERQVATLKEQEAQFASRLAAVEKANQEAQFSAAVSRLEAEAVAFVTANGKRLYGKRDREAVAAMYVNAGRASIGTTAEVHFSNEKGETAKGTLLDAFKASIVARPEHKLDMEQVPGPLTVLFGNETKDPEDEETERLRKALEAKIAKENARNGSRR